MADLEILKVIINGGSFALLSLIVIWILFKAGPAVKDTIETMAKEFRSILDQQSKECREERREDRDLYQKMLMEMKDAFERDRDDVRRGHG